MNKCDMGGTRGWDGMAYITEARMGMGDVRYGTAEARWFLFPSHNLTY
jgi:hypothetical protein